MENAHMQNHMYKQIRKEVCSWLNKVLKVADQFFMVLAFDWTYQKDTASLSQLECPLDMISL